MAEEVVEGEEKKGKGPIVMIIVAGVVLLVLLAGAIGGTLFATGFFDSKDKKAAEAKIAELEAGKGDGHGGGGDGHGAKDDGHGGKGDGHGAPAPAGGASGTAPVSKTAASTLPVNPVVRRVAVCQRSTSYGGKTSTAIVSVSST